MQPSNKLIIDSLNEDWSDKDYVMLHACFQILKDCIEQEKLLSGQIDWESDKRHQNAKDELEFLYNWWRERTVALDDGMSNESQYEEDNQMLHRLIDVRWALWT